MIKRPNVLSLVRRRGADALRKSTNSFRQRAARTDRRKVAAVPVASLTTRAGLHKAVLAIGGSSLALLSRGVPTRTNR